MANKKKQKDKKREDEFSGFENEDDPMDSADFSMEDLPPARPGSATRDEQFDKGIECPKCGCRHFYTVWTRPAPRNRIWRRRECRHCGHKITTYEQALG